MNTISELSPSEIRTLGRLEKRIEQRPQGGIGVGLDLLKIEDRQLYRDFQNFETYRAAKLPEIKSSTGYHLRSIARLWSRMKRNITPEGATELLAWDAFRRHRNVSTIDALSKIRTTAKQWQLYVLAFQVAGGVEPSPAHVREVARHLEIPVKRSVSEKRREDREYAFRLLLTIRNDLAGEKKWKNHVKMVDDITLRLGLRSSPRSESK